jgi:FtsP/CotA-like multicopper oxidase with cupredoxin domain
VAGDTRQRYSRASDRRSLLLAGAALLLCGRAGAHKIEPAPISGFELPQSKALQPFALRTSTGSVFSADSLRGRWSLLFFGFTHCPDVCPTALYQLQETRAEIGRQREPTPSQIVFVTIDPERDTAARMLSTPTASVRASLRVSARDAALRGAVRVRYSRWSSKPTRWLPVQPHRGIYCWDRMPGWRGVHAAAASRHGGVGCVHPPPSRDDLSDRRGPQRNAHLPGEDHMKTRIGTALLFLLGLTACGSDDPVALIPETFRNPPQLTSASGELRTTLRVATGPIQIAGQMVTTTTYNGLYTPPVLRLRPGDTLYLNVNNTTTDPTNLHLHGLNVSPRINMDATVSDNVFVSVDPGMQLNYRVAIPSTHNPGLYWYHTHLHTLAERQVMGGLSGGLIIDGILDPLPQLQGLTERILLLKDIQVTPQGTIPDDISPSAPSVRLVNGLLNPTISMRPGETQFFRIANIGSDLYYRLRLDGHAFNVLARDGNRANQVTTRNEIILPPSSRVEVLIQAAGRGTYPLRAEAFNTGPQGDSYPTQTIATIVSQGDSTIPMALPTMLPAVEDFRTLPIARRRTITFTESDDGNTFYVDSGAGPKEFDANVVDSTIVSGAVEEWTILNATGEQHTFHIHQTDFQVTEINGVPQPFLGHQDNVNVSYQDQDAPGPGQIKMIIDFRNPIIVGKFVYHCHILEHEDKGMMAVAEVVPMPLLASMTGRLMKVVQRVVQPNAEELARRAEET